MINRGTISSASFKKERYCKPGSLRVLYRFNLFATCLLLSVVWVAGATLPSGFTETPIASGLSNPTAMQFAPDGRLFVCLQGGQLRVIKNNALLPAPFLTVTTNSSGERGLLGIAFDPNFATNQFVYVYYTATTPAIHNRVSRFTANGDVAVSNSEVPILDLENLSATNHNGGAIHFGPDGKLYIAVGENANSANSQTLNNRLGKILRINSDGSIPSDNPFFNTAVGANRAIWALGLRNPFTFAFQPNTTRLFINDVGQSTWEEINDGVAGSNYGWPNTEGPTSNPNFRGPIFAYGRSPSDTGGCAITGGTFYNPSIVQFPSSYLGKYFFADFCSGWIRVLDPANNTATAFATGILSPVDLKVAADGSLYYLSKGSSSVFRVQFPANQAPPTVSAHPSNQSVPEGQTVTFTVGAAGTAPLSYQWQRNTVDISGANATSYTVSSASLADNGAKFRCVVSNSFGTATSNEATLTVAVNPPPLTIETEGNTDHAIALDSVTMVGDPFPLINPFNFSSDGRTRVMVFARNLVLLPREDMSAVTAQAETEQAKVYPLTVEFVGPLPGAESFTEVIVKFPDDLPVNQDVWISIRLHGATSNRARVKIR